MAAKDYECANVYVSEPFEPIESGTAAITSGTPNLTDSGNPFTVDMVGRSVIIVGAGTAGADLAAIITAFVGAGAVTLDTNAGTTVSGANARYNLIKLNHEHALTVADPDTDISDVLKSPDHPAWASAIQDPDWDRSQGFARVGGRNVLVYPFGFYANDGVTFVALHQMFPGRHPFCRFLVARAAAHVKIKGRMFAGFYNNNPLVLDWVKGDPFTIDGAVLGSPASTVSTQYMVVLETQQGFSIVSDVLTIASAPSNTGFSQGARVLLEWPYYAGTVNKKIYRKQGAGNVYLLEQDGSGSNQYVDVNISTRTDTGSASFPTFTNEQQYVRSYFAFNENLTDQISVNGVSDEWTLCEFRMPFVQSINMAQIFDPCLILGIDEPLATEITDAVVTGTAVQSDTGAFDAAMVGKNCTFTDSDGNTHSTTVSAFTDANNIAVTSGPGNGTYTLEIEDSQPNGLLFDQIGVSLTDGEWTYNPEDNSEARGTPVVIAPDGTSQGGGILTGDGGGGGGVIITCIHVDTMMAIQDGENVQWIAAKDILPGKHRVWNGLGGHKSAFNPVRWKRVAEVDEMYLVRTFSARIACTRGHRFVSTPETFVAGIPLADLSQGEKVLISDANSIRLEPITGLRRLQGKFEVVSFGLETKGRPAETRHLMVCANFVSHNEKPGGDIIIV